MAQETCLTSAIRKTTHLVNGYKGLSNVSTSASDGRLGQ